MKIKLKKKIINKNIEKRSNPRMVLKDIKYKR